MIPILSLIHIFDGSNKIKEYVSRVKELGMNSAAITDHGNMYEMCIRDSHGSFQKLGAIEPSCNVPGSIPQWRDCLLYTSRCV